MSTHDPMLDRLRVIPALRGQTDRALKALVPLVDRVDVPAGHQLTTEGVLGREMFVVVHGEADVYVDGERVAVIGPGDFVGEMALLDSCPRCATVRATTAMQALVIGPTAFDAFIRHGGVMQTIASQLARRLRQADSTLATGELPRSLTRNGRP